MCNEPTEPSMESIFGEVVSTYTRAQAIADGVLIDVGITAKEAGFRIPVAVTEAAWQDCIAWTERDNKRQVYQDQSGRLWDVLFMAVVAAKGCASGGDRLQFQLSRVPRDGRSTEPTLATLKLIVGPGDDGEPVTTILLPNED